MRRAVEGYHQGDVGLAELAAWYDQTPERLAEQLGPSRSIASGTDEVDDDLDDAPLFPPRPASAS